MDVSALNEEHLAVMETITSHMDLIELVTLMTVVVSKSLLHGHSGSQSIARVFEDPKGIFQSDTIISLDLRLDVLQSLELEVHSSLSTLDMLNFLKLKFIHQNGEVSQVVQLESVIEISKVGHRVVSLGEL